MRDLNELNGRRVVSSWGARGDGNCGAFRIPSIRTGATLMVIASSSEGWDHVSVSLPNRCPNWIEMDFIKRTFFKEEENAMQLHVPPEDHISCHPYCLHLWRPHDAEIPRPPGWMVGPKSPPHQGIVQIFIERNETPEGIAAREETR